MQVSDLLDHLPYIGKLRANRRTLRANMGRYPAGHYYSPIPNEDDVRRHVKQRNQQDTDLGNECPEIDLNTDRQIALLEEYSQFYSSLPWSDQQQPDLRYYYRQEWFCYADAISLYSHLRHQPPNRIVEVGSGFSSAVILDTSEKFLANRPEITLIEPNPSRLLSLLRPHDLEQIHVIEENVQNTQLDVFTELKSGDLLFIDSSHVLKAGSDLHFLFFDIFPKLSPGVIVHLHDIFYPFEYPDDWLLTGKYWNEAYFLRAFLAHNSVWKIRLFNSYLGLRHKSFLKQHMPLFLRNAGGSIYIEKIGI